MPVHLLVGALLLAGCSSTRELLRISVRGVSGDAPKIEEVIDLGALPMPAEGPLPTEHTDGKITPGEWVAILGKGLYGASVLAGGKVVAVQGHLQSGGVLVRWPAAPRSQKLEVQSAQGRAQRAVDAPLFLVGADTTAGQLRFLGTKPSARVRKLPHTVSLTRALFHAHAEHGGLLYAIGMKDEKTCTLKVVHLGAKEKPAVIQTLDFQISSQPTALIAGPRHLVALSLDSISVFSLGDGVGLSAPRRVELPRIEDGARYTAAVFLAPERIAVLDAEHNEVQTMTLNDGAARTQMRVGVGPKVSASLDLVVRKGALWVLQGPSLRGAAMSLGRAVRRAPAQRSAPRRLVEVPLTNSGALREIALPAQLIPLFVAVDHQGRFLVSATHADLLETEGGVDVAKVLNWLKDSVQMGRILRVDPARPQEVETPVRGVSVFLQVGVLPDDRILYSGMRLGGRMSPPFVGVNWGIGVEGAGHFALRKMDYRSFLPPYGYGQVSAGPR